MIVSVTSKGDSVVVSNKQGCSLDLSALSALVSHLFIPGDFSKMNWDIAEWQQGTEDGIH